MYMTLNCHCYGVVTAHGHISDLLQVLTSRTIRDRTFNLTTELHTALVHLTKDFFYLTNIVVE